MLDRAFRLWAEGVIRNSHSHRRQAETLLRQTLAERPGDHRTAIFLASLLIRSGSGDFWGTKFGMTDWFESFFYPDDDDDPCDGSGVHNDGYDDGPDGKAPAAASPWVIIDRNYEEATRLLDTVIQASPDDAVAILTLGTLWLERWDEYAAVVAELKSLADDEYLGDLPDEEQARRAVIDLAREGLAIGQRVVELCPHNAVSSLVLAVSLAAFGEVTGAAERCGHLEAHTPGVTARHEMLAALPVKPRAASAAGSGGYSWYRIERIYTWANNGDTDSMALVTADPAEVRWACDLWAETFRDIDAGLPFTLEVYESGRLSTKIDLPGDIGLAGDVPELTGEPLPFGMPVLVDGFPSVGHHGYSMRLDS